ncbi:L-rhamnose mutarotase [Sphingobacterium rhinopitheci]|uniref:L-rhamnose mutarotase n=1 Tax=Sphingobacterium rhinopitheci TaxID=2781960 RepID=UPI001F5283DF|nr:L-rhamnose mutarotase [Sphingobacterium rhinopitheci]MCI0920905.1 L-rhamnose mutarotase [Sphingobacterium rhinopitheci]
MSVVAFKMKLKSGVVEEYQRRHRTIWPDLVKHLKEMGLSEYRIFLDPDDQQTLFAIQTRAGNYDDTQLRNHPIMKQWWDYMADLMYVEDDNSPVASSLTEVFYMP